MWQTLGISINRNIKHLKRHFEFLLLVGLVTIYFVWFAWPLIWTASESIRLISAFSRDEMVHALLLKIALEKSSLNLEFYSYGHLYFYVTLLPLLILSYFTPVSEQAIIVSLRFVSAIFGVGTILITFVLSRRYFSRLTAWLSASLLMIVPLNFLFWSVTSHPDIPQLFFMVLSIYFCLRLAQQGHWKWLVWASVTAGLAFATKYSGVFLLPVVWLVMIIQNKANPYGDKIKISISQFIIGARYIILMIGMATVIGSMMITTDFSPARSLVGETQHLTLLNIIRGLSILVGSSLVLLIVLKMLRSTINTTSIPISGLNKIVFKITLSVATFGLAFVSTSPFLFLGGMRFLVGMLWESNHVSYGHEFVSDKNGLLWFDVLMSPQLLDGVILSLAAASLAFAVYTLFKTGWKELLSPQVIVWIWIVFYLSFLVLRVNLRAPRFALPIIPFLIILAMHLVSQLFNYATRKISKKYAPVLAIGIVLFIGGLEFPGAFDRIIDFRNSTMNREQANSAVATGEWLAATYPPSTRIFYDDYSYVPPLFPNAHLSPWTGETISILDELNPDLVIVSQVKAGRFSNPDQAGDYSAGERNFMGKYEYYKQLKSGDLGYDLVKDFGDIQVYARQQQLLIGYKEEQ